MGYHRIPYNQQGEPYIVEKNFGHDPKGDESSSHWTWHITPRGVEYLTRKQFGQHQAMPRFIHNDVEQLKTFNIHWCHLLDWLYDRFTSHHLSVADLQDILLV